MKKKGFSFIECILAIGIISIIAVSVFPIIDSSTKVYSRITINNELRTIAQSTIETLKSEDPLSSMWITKLEDRDSIDVNSHYIKDGYECKIKKIFNSEQLMEVEVIVTNIDSKDVKELVLKASIRK